jgi:hypothetical protein
MTKSDGEPRVISTLRWRSDARDDERRKYLGTDKVINGTTERRFRLGSKRWPKFIFALHGKAGAISTSKQL